MYRKHSAISEGSLIKYRLTFEKSKMPMSFFFRAKDTVEKSELLLPLNLNIKPLNAIQKITKKKYTVDLGTIKFIVPEKEKLDYINIGKKFSFNKEGLLLYAGKETEQYINEIAEKYKIEPLQIVLPAKADAEEMFKNKIFIKTLWAAKIYWIPFIIDPDNEQRNVSLTEYWLDPDKYSFCYRYTGNDFWDYYDPDFFNINCVLMIGFKK